MQTKVPQSSEGF